MTSALAKIHIGKKALGLDDDTYRAMLERLTGQTSAKGLSQRRLGRVLAEMEAKGAFKTHSKAVFKPLEGRYAKKLQALWIAGYNLGIIQSKEDKALLAFVERQTGLSHLRFLHYPQDARQAIEGLKAWIAREAGFSWGGSGQTEEDFAARIAYRQWQILRAAGVKSVRRGNAACLLTADFAGAVSAFCGQAPSQADWIALMNAWGREIRKCGR